VSGGFGGARTRAGIYSEHVRAEKDEVRYPFLSATHQLISTPLTICAIKWRKLSGVLYCCCSSVLRSSAQNGLATNAINRELLLLFFETVEPGYIIKY